MQTAKVVVAKRTLVVVVERHTVRRRFRPDSPHVEQLDICFIFFLILCCSLQQCCFVFANKIFSTGLGVLARRNQESSTLTCDVVMSFLADDSVSRALPASRFTRGPLLVAGNWGSHVSRRVATATRVQLQRAFLPMATGHVINGNLSPWNGNLVAWRQIRESCPRELHVEFLPILAEGQTRFNPTIRRLT